MGPQTFWLVFVTQILDKNNLEEEKFITAHSIRGPNPQKANPLVQVQGKAECSWGKGREEGKLLLSWQQGS